MKDFGPLKIESVSYTHLDVYKRQVLAIAIRPPVNLHAAETRPIAVAATRATAPSELITLYDDGAPRDDELNQLQWYGDRYFVPLWQTGQPGKLSIACLLYTSRCV